MADLTIAWQTRKKTQFYPRECFHWSLENLLCRSTLESIQDLNVGLAFKPKHNFSYHMLATLTCGFYYIFYPIFTAVRIVERFVLQTIYVLNKEIVQFWVLNLRFIIESRNMMVCVLHKLLFSNSEIFHFEVSIANFFWTSWSLSS